MGFGPNFTRVAVGPNAQNKKKLFIDGASNGAVDPHIDILWIEAGQVQVTPKFSGMAFAPEAKQHSLGSFPLKNTQWRVEKTPPNDFPAPGTWISISGRMKSTEPGAPEYIVWSNMLKVEKAEKPG